MHSTEKLAALITRKHEVLVQLRAIGSRQTDLVSSGEITALLKLLSAKQQLIARLQELELELKPYYTIDPEQRAWRTPEARAHCPSQAPECNTSLEEIERREKVRQEEMKNRKK